jgi:hypothetical protein
MVYCLDTACLSDFFPRPFDLDATAPSVFQVSAATLPANDRRFSAEMDSFARFVLKW